MRSPVLEVSAVVADSVGDVVDALDASCPADEVSPGVPPLLELAEDSASPVVPRSSAPVESS